ncbi:MAG: hypothetical protein GX495_19220 [Chloroflexi bacterium]|jgi:hypothetical protein|nr:hypothetical protein [Chloroflexota bacterium]
MRKVALLIIAAGILILVVAFYPTYVQKPEKDGTGPLAVRLDPQFTAPEYHSPLDWWQTHHFDAVNRGDFEKADCLYCHVPETSCNNCHGYVGVDPIEEIPEVERISASE